MIKQKDFKFDDVYQTVEVCGVKYAYEIFEAFGTNGLEKSTLFRFEDNKDGVVVITKFYDEANMDTSKEYIKMCEKATEIQKEYKIGYDETNYYYHDFVIIPSKYWSAGDHIIVDSDNEAYSLYKPIWLPDQSQLQDIYQKYSKLNLLHLTDAFFDWLCTIIQHDEHGVQSFIKPVHSMEQLWLAFVMKEKWGKIWDGSDWVLTTSS